MRTVEFKKSFDRSFRALQPQEQIQVEEVIAQFLDRLEGGIIPKGLGLKRLRGDIWEIRVDLRLRIGFRIEKSRIKFGVAGDHDSIKRFLKNY